MFAICPRTPSVLSLTWISLTAYLLLSRLSVFSQDPYVQNLTDLVSKEYRTQFFFNHSFCRCTVQCTEETFFECKKCDNGFFADGCQHFNLRAIASVSYTGNYSKGSTRGNKCKSLRGFTTQTITFRNTARKMWIRVKVTQNASQTKLELKDNRGRKIPCTDQYTVVKDMIVDFWCSSKTSPFLKKVIVSGYIKSTCDVKVSQGREMSLNRRITTGYTVADDDPHPPSMAVDLSLNTYAIIRYPHVFTMHFSYPLYVNYIAIHNRKDQAVPNKLLAGANVTFFNAKGEGTLEWTLPSKASDTYEHYINVAMDIYVSLNITKEFPTSQRGAGMPISHITLNAFQVCPGNLKWGLNCLQSCDECRYLCMAETGDCVGCDEGLKHPDCEHLTSPPEEMSIWPIILIIASTIVGLTSIWFCFIKKQRSDPEESSAKK